MRKTPTTATPSTEAMFRALKIKRVADACICRDFFNAKKGLVRRRLVALIYGRYGASVQEVTDASHLERLRDEGEAIHYYSASPDQAEQIVRSARLVWCKAGNQSQIRKPLPSLRP